MRGGWSLLVAVLVVLLLDTPTKVAAKQQELKLSELVAGTPTAVRSGLRYMRTPGQILSLTSHLSFRSEDSYSTLGNSTFSDQGNSSIVSVRRTSLKSRNTSCLPHRSPGQTSQISDHLSQGSYISPTSQNWKSKAVSPSDAVAPSANKDLTSHDIPWPKDDEALSSAAVETLDQLMAHDPKVRANFESVKCSSLFSCIDWSNLKDTVAPFIPQPDDAMDTTYFEARNNIQQLKVSNFDL